MRVAFVVANYPPSIGGAQLLVQRIAEGLVQRHGCRVRVLTTDALLAPGGPDPGRIPCGTEWEGGVEVIRAPVARRAHAALRDLRRASQVASSSNNAFVRWTQPAASGPLGRRLAAAVRVEARRCDVLVGVSTSFLSLPMAVRAAHTSGAASVTLPLVHVTGAAVPPSASSAVRRSDLAVALTSYEQDWLVRSGVERARSTVIPAGCDPASFPDQEPQVARGRLGIPERPTIGYVGRMAAHKGIDTLAAAMRRIWAERADVNLLLAGNHTGWSEFDRIVSDLEQVAGDRLIVRHGFDESEKAELMGACEVIAFPSREESFGIVTLEGWCARRPVVAGDIGAVRSIVRDGIDGVLLPVADDAAWAAELLRLIDDPRLRDQLGRSGRRRVEQEFSWEHVVDRWHEVLVQVGRPVPRTSERSR